jgi:hypothetical protein
MIVSLASGVHSVVKAITLRQPLASLTAMGCLNVIVSGSATHYRGPLLIHASNRWSFDEEVKLGIAEEFAGGTLLAGRPPLRAVVGIAKLTDCEPAGRRHKKYGLIPANWVQDMHEVPRTHLFDLEFDGVYELDKFGWFISSAVALPEPIPWPGANKLWVPPEELLAKIRQQHSGVWPVP